MKRPILMIPGPVDVSDEVLDAMGGAVVAHYGADWVPVYQETVALLQYAFRSSNWVLILPGSGTTGLDASIGSLLRRGEKVLVLSNGPFGERLAAVASAYELDVHRLTFSSLQPIPLDQVKKALQAGGWKAALMVHHETSSGVLNPAREMSALCHEYQTPFILDAVSSLGTVELDTDGWGIDLCVSASQKGLEAPPGLGLISISDRAWKIMAQKAPVGHGFCLNLLTWRDYIERWGDWHPSAVTMPTNNILALRASLRLLREEGLENRWARYRQVALAVRTGLRNLGFEPLVKDEWAATAITAVKPPQGIDPGDIRDHLLKKHNILIARGAGEWQEQALRIGHMGSGSRPDHLVRLLAGLEDTLIDLGCKVVRGSSLAGVHYLKNAQ